MLVLSLRCVVSLPCRTWSDDESRMHDAKIEVLYLFRGVGGRVYGERACVCVPSGRQGRAGLLRTDSRRLNRRDFFPPRRVPHGRYRPPTGDDWYKEYAIGLKVGRECCSRDSISFHYVDENLMQRLFHLVYSCPKKRPRMPEDLPVAV